MNFFFIGDKGRIANYTIIYSIVLYSGFAYYILLEKYIVCKNTMFSTAKRICHYPPPPSLGLPTFL